jgi:hypothetical protein
MRASATRVSDDVLERVEELAEQIANLFAHVHAATARLLVMIAEFDELRGWDVFGYRDCADWLAAHIGIDRGAAQEKVRAARALTRLPLTRAAMARGELSFSKVRALTRVAEPANEQQLLELARGATAGTLERMLRAWRKGTRKDEAERERERFESRTLSIFPDDEGMYVIRGRLTPEVGALLMRAVEAGSDELYREKPNPLVPDEQRRKDAAQRRADAIGLLAERALAGGSSDASPLSGSSAERYQVVLHVDTDTLSAESEPGRSELQEGTRLSAESARRLACDANVVRVAQKPDGTVLSVGRKTRTVPPAIRRALDMRDRGCRFPGCGKRFTDAHHLKHWADGGETSLGNLVLLCRHHHRLVHEGRWRTGTDGEGRPLFFDPRGGMHYEGRWQPPRLGEDAVERLLEEQAALGIAADGWAARPWEREADVPNEVYFAVSATM